jgi:hypothetical protein
MSATQTDSTAAATSPASNGGNNSGPTSSPLLFFVALGFGVVFTNLWYAQTAFTCSSLLLLTSYQDHRWCQVLLQVQPPPRSASSRRWRANRPHPDAATAQAEAREEAHDHGRGQ